MSHDVGRDFKASCDHNVTPTVVYVNVTMEIFFFLNVTDRFL